MTVAQAYRYAEARGRLWNSIRKGYWRCTLDGRRYYGETRTDALRIASIEVSVATAGEGDA